MEPVYSGHLRVLRKVSAIDRCPLYRGFFQNCSTGHETRLPIPIEVEDKSIKFTYRSFSRGYHAYMNSWNPIVGDDSLICEREDNNEHDEHAVAVMYHDSISWKVVGHVPLHLSQVMSNFLRFPNCSIRVTITGKRVNRGVGLGLEIPVHYIFYGDEG